MQHYTPNTAQRHITPYSYMQLINIPVIFPVLCSMSVYSDVKSIELFLSLNILIVT